MTINQEVMGSHPIVPTRKINMLAATSQTKYPAEINQGNNWDNATNRPAAAPLCQAHSVAFQVELLEPRKR